MNFRCDSGELVLCKARSAVDAREADVGRLGRSCYREIVFCAMGFRKLPPPSFVGVALGPIDWRPRVQLMMASKRGVSLSNACD
jgi:hypothetical protein